MSRCITQSARHGKPENADARKRGKTSLPKTETSPLLTGYTLSQLRAFFDFIIQLCPRLTVFHQSAIKRAGVDAGQNQTDAALTGT